MAHASILAKFGGSVRRKIPELKHPEEECGPPKPFSKFGGSVRNPPGSQIKPGSVFSKFGASVKKAGSVFKPVDKSNAALCARFGGSIRRKGSVKRSPSLEFKGKDLVLCDFELFDRVGTKRFGQLIFAKLKKGGVFCTLMRIERSQLKKKHLDFMLEREIKIQTVMRHTNVLHMYSFFQDALNLYMVYERAQGIELTALMAKQPDRRFPNEEAVMYVSQVAKALQYCHDKGIIHRNIKPENIIITDKEELKLTDFGMSLYSPMEEYTPTVGSLLYLAPEILSDVLYDHRCDIWSLGILTYELLAGYLPFFTRNLQLTDLIMEMKDKKYRFPKHFEKPEKRFISKLLRFDRIDRMSLQNALEHEWITGDTVE